MEKQHCRGHNGDDQKAPENPQGLLPGSIPQSRPEPIQNFSQDERSESKSASVREAREESEIQRESKSSRRVPTLKIGHLIPNLTLPPNKIASTPAEDLKG